MVHEINDQSFEAEVLKSTPAGTFGFMGAVVWSLPYGWSGNR